MCILKTEHLIRNYTMTGASAQTSTIHVLKDIDFEVEKGEFVAIMGKSGCGKSTFLKLLGMIERPTAGAIYFDGMDTEELWKDELADIRRRRIGFVFQDFYLLDSLNVRDNILLPMILDKADSQVMKDKVAELAGRFGIDHLLLKAPYELSGGEKTAGRHLPRPHQRPGTDPGRRANRKPGLPLRPDRHGRPERNQRRHAQDHHHGHP